MEYLQPYRAISHRRPQNAGHAPGSFRVLGLNGRERLGKVEGSQLGTVAGKKGTWGSSSLGLTLDIPCLNTFQILAAIKSGYRLFNLVLIETYLAMEGVTLKSPEGC